jgi:DNA-binding winged helix-turn-helix (wHTH) protein
VTQSTDISFGDLEIRPHEHTVLVRGLEVPLTSREFEIVLSLAEHPGWVFSAAQLSGDMEGDDYSPESVSVLISRLRQKLASAGACDVVETVRGMGYRLHTPVGGAQEPLAAGGASRQMRDALWQLQEAVMEAERSATLEQQYEIADRLDQTRRAVFGSLAE